MHSRFTSRRGQSGLEYMGMVVFITMGLLLIGPYVVRSVNAPYKSLEQGAVDSQREVIRQAPPQGVNLPECNCTDMLRQGCGDGSGGCSVRQAVWQRFCDPQGCEVDMQRRGIFGALNECRNDPYPSPCCTAWAATGRCGISAQNPALPGGRCPDGQMEQQRDCGSPAAVREYRCQVDDLCDFDCMGGRSPTSTACPNTEIDLTSDTNWSYVVYNGCNGATKCQAHCNSGLVPMAGGCVNQCGNGVCDLGETACTCCEDCCTTLTCEARVNNCGVVASARFDCNGNPWLRLQVQGHWVIGAWTCAVGYPCDTGWVQASDYAHGYWWITPDGGGVYSHGYAHLDGINGLVARGSCNASGNLNTCWEGGYTWVGAGYDYCYVRPGGTQWYPTGFWSGWSKTGDGTCGNGYCEDCTSEPGCGPCPPEPPGGGDGD